jgi:hypothetical protein
MILTGKEKSSKRKPCSSVTLPTTHLTWTGLGSNPMLRNEKSATDNLNLDKGKVHPCTANEALYRPYGLQGEKMYSSTLS